MPSRGRTCPASSRSIVAGALLIDYTMTVAVSTSSAVEQVISAVPDLEELRVEIGVVAIVLIMIGNLRGLRESGNIFAIPTYLFAGSTLLMVAIGLFRVIVLGESAPPPEPLPGAGDPLQVVGILLIIKAFASGSVALTGTEAIANGVPAFKRPEPRNAATTLTVMAILLGVLFIGITFVADSFGVVPIDEPATEDGHQPGRRDDLRRQHDPVLPLPDLHGPDPVPCREHLVQRVSRAWQRSSPTTASCHASSASVATASRSPRGS